MAAASPSLGKTTAGANALARLRTVTTGLSPHTGYLLALAAFVLAAGLPLFQFKLMSGHDTFAYLPRYVEFYEALRDGEIIPRWSQNLGAGYGEPTFNFNPPLLYYLVSLFHSLGFGYIESESLALFALLVVAAIGMYVLANEVFGRRAALVAAVAYVFSPYLLMTLYVRHALADYAAFAFVPFAFWGVYAASSRRRMLALVVGSLAVAGLLLTSISVAVIAIPALLLPALLVAWAHRSIVSLALGIWTIVLGLGLSAYFWLPALTETEFVHISRREEGPLNFHNHFVYIQQLVYSAWGYGLSVPGADDGLSFGLGPVHLIVSLAALLLAVRIWRASREAGLIVVSFLVLLGLTTFFMTKASLEVWEQVGALHPLQFPWRFLSLAATATAVLCGAPFVLALDPQTPRTRRLANGAMVLVLAGIFLWGFRYAHPERYLDTTDSEFTPERIATEGIAATAREFEPIDVREFPAEPAPGPVTVFSGRAAVATTRNDVERRRYRVQVDEQAILRINTFYFPGWKLTVDGAERTVAHANPQGLMELTLEPGTHTLVLTFEDTAVRTRAMWISIGSLAALILTPVVARALRRRPPRPIDLSQEAAR